MRDLRLPVVVAVFLAVVAAGIGLRELYYQKRVIDPFSASAQAIGGVAAVELFHRGDGSNDVLLTLEPGAKIEEVYPQVEALARSILRGAYGRVVVKEDDPLPALWPHITRFTFPCNKASALGFSPKWPPTSSAGSKGKRASLTVSQSANDTCLSI